MTDTHARVPWSAEQAASLNDYQHSGLFHEYTCGNGERHLDEQPILIATEDGWVCPDDGCDYRQTWAHWWAADRSWESLRDEFEEKWIAGDEPL